MEKICLTPMEVREIYEIINQKDFPKIKTGRDIRIPKSEFEKFMKRLLYSEYKM